MSKISIKNLSKSYGEQPVLREIDLDIAHGEFVTLIGPSGCGKSTLLKIIAGLEDASGGEIWIGDKLMTTVPPQKRDLAMVFQNYALYPQMTVRQNLSFGLKVAGVKPDEIRRRTEEIAGILEIHAYLDRRPRELSGGQRQRVAMGRAMVREPSAFLLDEPLSNLDAALRTAMRSEIKTLHQRLGRTMVYVTHDQVEAMTMADRIAIMKAGEIKQFATPAQLYERPASTFVASFFGTPQINLWDATVEGEADGRLAVRIAKDVTLMLPAVNDLKEREFMLGVRPEALVLGEKGIPARVALVEPTGAQTQITIEFEGGVKGSLLASGQSRHRTGDSVFVEPAIAQPHLFGRQSGQRLN